MAEAYIIDAVRTPVGKRGGGLSQVHPADLGAHVLNGIFDRVDVDPAAVEDVYFGCVDAIGPQAGDIARTAWLAAGLPEAIPGTTIDRDELVLQYENAYLRAHAEDVIYPVIGKTYRECKESEINLGLDLKGGMAITLEVSIPELVENLSENSTDPAASWRANAPSPPARGRPARNPSRAGSAATRPS
mgnify:CR=1 FL=1